MEIILWTGIILVVLVVGAIVLAAAVRGMRPKEPEALVYMPTQTTARSAPTPASGLSPHLSPEAVAEIDRLVTAGQKIQAIKVYRDSTGVRLQEAKDRIDHWSVSHTTASVATTHTAPAHSAVPASVASVRSSLPAPVAGEIDRLVANDQKIQAIKALREHTGFGLKESKDLIEAWPSSRRP